MRLEKWWCGCKKIPCWSHRAQTSINTFLRQSFWHALTQSWTKTCKQLGFFQMDPLTAFVSFPSASLPATRHILWLDKWVSKLPSTSHRFTVTASIHVQQLYSLANNLSFPSLIMTFCRSGTSSFKCWNLRQASRVCLASAESHPKAFMMLLIVLTANSFSTYCPVIDCMAEVGQQYTHCLWYWRCLWHALYEH